MNQLSLLITHCKVQNDENSRSIDNLLQEQEYMHIVLLLLMDMSKKLATREKNLWLFATFT
jgi:hypothetical protein